MDDFHTSIVGGPDFATLLASAQFEELGKGRRGANLGDALVRSTTPYRLASQRFGPLHRALAPPGANHAVIEHYTRAYSTMKRHSDQALDLAEGSSIAIFSCYRDPDRPSRRLIVRSKRDDTGGEIVLAHGSMVTFTVEANRLFTHTIASNGEDNDWLGLTFRTSKTFVRFDCGPSIDGVPLTLATEAQRHELYQLKRRENEETDVRYPPIAYTLSEGDLLPPR